MPQIKITDSLSVELTGLSPNAGIASALNKYVKTPFVELFAAPELLRDVQKPLLTAAATPVAFGLTSRFPIALGSSGTELSIVAGAKAAFQVVNAGQDDFLSDSPFGDSIPVPDGFAYAAFTTTASLDSALDAEFGDLTFGFEAGGSIELMSALRLKATATEPTVGSALRQVLERFGVPGDIDDLDAMPEGAVAAVAGDGRLAVSASVDLAATVNPIATPALPLKLGQVEVKAGASLTVDAAFAVSGGYQIRVLKTGARRVLLGYYKMAGSEFEIGVTSMASAGVTLRNRNLVEMVIGAISKKPDADLLMLVDGGLTDEAIEAIQKTVRDAVDRSLSVALHAGISSLGENEAAFLYDIDLDQLDATGRAAVHDALDGNLMPLTALESAPGQHGIQVLRSETRRLRKTGATLKINLLGIVNVLTIRELIRQGRVLVDPSTSTLVIADSITATKISVASKPFEADGKKLRKILFESFVTTAALRAGALGAAMDLSSSYTFFEFREKTNRQAMSDHLDAVVAAGLITEAQKRDRLTDIRDFGASTFLLESVFSNAACEALFLDANGEPLDEDFYDRIGRNALVALVRPGDESDFRAIVLADDALWARLREVGQPGIAFALPAHLRNPAMVAVIQADYTVIRWWATSMHRVAVALAGIKLLLSDATFDTLRSNHQFRDTHRKFELLLADVVKKSGSQFGDPWGLIALIRAAERHLPKRTALIVSPKLTLAETIDEK